MLRVTCRCGEKLSILARAPSGWTVPSAEPRSGCAGRLPRKRMKGAMASCASSARAAAGSRCRSRDALWPGVARIADASSRFPRPRRARSTRAQGKNSRKMTPKARTEELDTDDLTLLRDWAARHAAAASDAEVPSPGSTALHNVDDSAGLGGSLEFMRGGASPPSTVKFETGLRICPRCKKPVHSSAANCRECGTPVPRK